MNKSEITVVPANEAAWDDLQAIFGAYDAARCMCKRHKIWCSYSREVLAERLRDQTCCGDPDSPTTTGLVAYVDGEPVGWCAVEPRNAYERLRSVRTPWTGRDEDKDDATVWAVTCFVTRAGYRKRRVTYLLASRRLRAGARGGRTRGLRDAPSPARRSPGVSSTWGR